LKDPVLQLLRNAISHGSEAAARRRARGRPPATRIRLALRSGGGWLTVTVTDDGPGPDLAAIRRRALDRGLLSPATAQMVTTEQLLALVFEPGFSTRSDVGQLSGRGMGLSIVAEAAHALGGTARMAQAQSDDVSVGGSRQSGTTVEIAVPLLVARQTAVMLGFGEVTVALPAAALLRLLRVPVERIEPMGGQMCVRVDGPASTLTAPVAVLGDLLGMAGRGLPVHDGHVKLAVIRGGHFGQRLALAVDRFHDVRRFLSHSADIIGIDTDLVAGFVMIGSETPAALLSPDGMVARWTRRGGWSGERAADSAEPEDGPVMHTILVADDSITSRTLEKSILEAHGYRVVVAVDGLEALEMLQTYGGRRRGDHGLGTEGMIDMVLADIEMPRMDGFSLLQAMKENSALADIPVIIMTSRESAADVRRGLDLGASAYIAKQTFDQQDLLGAIGRLL
jgi:two-component system chemotaxis sensor kinase CheA